MERTCAERLSPLMIDMTAPPTRHAPATTRGGRSEPQPETLNSKPKPYALKPYTVQSLSLKP